MGPYCQFCARRCFLPRTLPDGTALIMATCAGGMARDREQCGYDHTTALNPVLHLPRQEPENGWRETCGCLTNQLGAHRAACPEFETVYPSDWWKNPRDIERLAWRRRGVA